LRDAEQIVAKKGSYKQSNKSTVPRFQQSSSRRLCCFGVSHAVLRSQEQHHTSNVRLKVSKRVSTARAQPMLNRSLSATHRSLSATQVECMDEMSDDAHGAHMARHRAQRTQRLGCHCLNTPHKQFLLSGHGQLVRSSGRFTHRSCLLPAMQWLMLHPPT